MVGRGVADSIHDEPVPITGRFRGGAFGPILAVMIVHPPPVPTLSQRLLVGLAPFRRGEAAGSTPHGDSLFSYCALTRERLAAIRLDHPVLAVVLSGAKEVWRGDAVTVLGEGDVFALPARVAMDVVNVPSARTGFYQSLIVEIPADTLPPVTMVVPPPADARRNPPVGITLTPHLVEALVHAASAIADGPAGPLVRASRLAELLALLRADPAAAVLFRQSVGQRVAQTVATDLSAPWTAPQVARLLAMSEATLRRRLAAEALSFGALLRRERMVAARRLLETGASAQNAALAVGYASRAHFARHFRAAFGLLPGQVRR
ncbi:MAG: AraC family transcriptional regulator [Zavarzinia sp.]|nr:AraC family transcriptional regulator [Zavarzinia sp.]